MKCVQNCTTKVRLILPINANDFNSLGPFIVLKQYHSLSARVSFSRVLCLFAMFRQARCAWHLCRGPNWGDVFPLPPPQKMQLSQFFPHNTTILLLVHCLHPLVLSFSLFFNLFYSLNVNVPFTFRFSTFFPPNNIGPLIAPPPPVFKFIHPCTCEWNFCTAGNIIFNWKSLTQSRLC
jgi:hypothetical protein